MANTISKINKADDGDPLQILDNVMIFLCEIHFLGGYLCSHGPHRPADAHWLGTFASLTGSS
jgi:hypothetical protein